MVLMFPYHLERETKTLSRAGKSTLRLLPGRLSTAKTIPESQAAIDDGDICVNLTT